MKKITVLFTVLIVLLSSCSYKNDEMYIKLSKQYPDAEITKKGDIYRIISENVTVDLSNAEILYNVCNIPRYSDISKLEQAMNAINNIAFRGKKTGESKQYIAINAKTGETEDFYTESRVEVLEAFYGNINVGDQIIYREKYAVFNEEDGKAVTKYYRVPTDSEEYIYVLFGSTDSILFKQRFYSDMSEDSSPIKISSTSKRFDGSVFIADRKELSDEIYEKYIINRDTET